LSSWTPRLRLPQRHRLLWATAPVSLSLSLSLCLSLSLSLSLSLCVCVSLALLSHAVGYGAALQLGVSATALSGLGLEGFVASTGTGVPAGSVVLTGGKGAPRGVLYATNNFTEAIGVQFLAQDTTVLPPSLPSLPTMNPGLQPFIPALEYRQQFEW
jgi:hypothetical protein